MEQQTIPACEMLVETDNNAKKIDETKILPFSLILQCLIQ